MRRYRPTFRSFHTGLLLTSVGMFSLPAMAQTAAGITAAEDATDIVVTAQRREERLQDVPIAVSAFGGELMESAGVETTIDLPMLTPGLQFGTQAAYGQPFIRGVGTVGNGPGVENPVALYVDGVYFGSSIGSIQTLNNVDRIEVLKGPQGTLFGRNATGGLIQVITKDPSETFGGMLGAGYGSYQTSVVDLYLTGPLGDGLAADLSGHFQDQGKGFGTNAFTGTEVNKTQDLVLRSKIKLDRGDTQMKLIFDYQRQEFRQGYVPAPGTRPLGDVPYTGDPQGLNGIYDPDGKLEQGGVSFQLRHKFDAVELVSISAYRASHVYQSFDGALTRDPASVLNLEINEKHKQITQEFQLNSLGSGPFTWSTGAFYYYNDGKSDPLTITTQGLFGPLAEINVFSRQKSTSLSGYGQGTIAIGDNTNITAGARYTWERRKFDISETLFLTGGIAIPAPPAESGRKTFKKLTWRLSADHHFNDDLMGYASYNRGYKSGGFNDYLIAPSRIYSPEVLDAFEVGFKADLANRRVQFNASGFYYIYKNIQAVEYPQGVQIIRNAAEAEIYGIDVDLTARLGGGLTLRAGAEYLHHRFTSFPDATIAIPQAGGGTAFTSGDVKGNRLGLAPDFTGNVSIDYHMPGTGFRANLSYAYNDGFFAEPENRLRQPSYSLVNAQLSWTTPDDALKFTLWARNLLDKDYTVALASQDTGDFAVYAPPRTYGVKAEFRF